MIDSHLPFYDSQLWLRNYGVDMDSIYEDGFLVYVRADTAHDNEPETNEEPLAICASYQEARRVKHDAARKRVVIRYAGSTGGGD